MKPTAPHGVIAGALAVTPLPWLISFSLGDLTYGALMTPAVAALRNAGIDFSLHAFDPSATCGEAAQAIGIDPAEMFRTLVTELDDGQIIVAVIPVLKTLDLKALARAAEGKKARMADAEVAERTTRCKLGNISPVGHRKPLPTLIDEAASLKEWIYVSAGKNAGRKSGSGLRT